MINIFRRSASLLVFGMLLCSGAANAATESWGYTEDDNPNLEPAYSFSNDMPSNTFWNQVNLELGYTSRRGIGRNFGYSTIALAYCPENECSCFSPYFDIRAHYMDNSRWAGNVGLGIQTRFDESRLRGYVFYDFLDTSFKFLQQITVGAEWLSLCFDFDARVNGYIPFTTKGHAKKTEFFYTDDQVATRIRNNHTWWGIDLEVSRYFCIFSHDFYASIGPYVFHSNKNRNRATGGKIRIESQFYKGISLAVQYSYDSRFHSRVDGQVTWTVPFGMDPCCDAICCQPVQREEIIVVSKSCHWITNF